MTVKKVKKDLILLVADGTMKAAFQAVLQRHRALGIRQIQFDIFVHPHRDSGVRLRAANFLLPFVQQHAHALVFFDREGSGSQDDAKDMVKKIEDDLSRHGWEDRAKAIVIDPELEAWVWSESPHVAEALGWKDRRVADILRELNQPVFGIKPQNPKEAMQAALRKSRRPLSASLHAQIAAKVSLTNCTDPAFCQFRSILSNWFPVD